MKRVENREGYYTYRCNYCGHECFDKHGLASGLTPTKSGDFGSVGTPTPATFSVEMYESMSISFTAETATEPAKINDSLCLFGEKGFQSGMSITVVQTDNVLIPVPPAARNSNEGTYTIGDRGVTRGILSLSSSDSLITQNAGPLAAGTVTLSLNIYQPLQDLMGCPFCNSLNSKGN